MPRISEFYGIAISIYWSDHPPPHFHARYADYAVSLEIASGRVLGGRLPPRALRLVREWMRLHRSELFADWELAERNLPLATIEPLP